MHSRYFEKIFTLMTAEEEDDIEHSSWTHTIHYQVVILNKNKEPISLRYLILKYYLLSLLEVGFHWVSFQYSEHLHYLIAIYAFGSLT